MRKTILSLLLSTFGALAQPVFLAEGNYNPYDANLSPLFHWNGSSFVRAAPMTGYSMETTAGGVTAFRDSANRTWVVAIQPFYNANFFIFEFVGGAYVPKGSVRVGNPFTGAKGVIVNNDGTRAYVLTHDGFLHTVDISNLNAPVVIGSPISVPNGAKFDLRPQGDRILVVATNAVVYDIDLATSNVATVNLSLPYFQPQVRYAPNGAFAYFGIEDAQRRFVVMNTSTWPASFQAFGPGLNNTNLGLGTVVFHPTLPRAYFTMSGGAFGVQTLYVIDTTTHTLFSTPQIVNYNLIAYGMAIEPDGSALWIPGSFNFGWLNRVPLNAQGAPQMATVTQIPVLPTAIFSMSLVRPLAPALLAWASGKNGPKNARVWPVNVRNLGASTIFDVKISAINVTPATGTVCSSPPVVTTAIPLAYGTLAPNQTVARPVTIDFSGCPNNGKFNVDVTVGTGLAAKKVPVANNAVM